MDEELHKSNVKLLKSDLIQVAVPDAEEVAKLVQKAKGDDRTLKEFSDEVGISAPTLSRIMNGKFTKPLSLDTIVSIVSHSDSYTLKTMFELARANGYMSKAEQASMRYHSKFINARNELYAQIKRGMLTIIIAELVQRGMTNDKRLFDSEPDGLPTATDSMIHYDFAMNAVTSAGDYKWAFFTFPQSVKDFDFESGSAKKIVQNLLKELSPVLLTDTWEPDLYKDYRMTFCFVDKEMYEEFIRILNRGKFNADLSTVLLDFDSHSVVEETLFSCKVQRTSPFSVPKVMTIDFNKESVTNNVNPEENVFVKEEGGSEC